MVKKDKEIGGNVIYIGIIKKSLSTILLFCSISLISILATFNPVDKGWGVMSEKPPTNLFNEFGAWLSGLIIREFGIFPGLLLSLVLFIWSLWLIPQYYTAFALFYDEISSVNIQE